MLMPHGREVAPPCASPLTKVAPSSDALTDQQTECRQIAQAGKRQFLNSAVHRQCNHNTDDRTVNR